MDTSGLLDRWGTGPVLALGGALVGMAFGFFAQRSRFCLRAAIIEFWHARFGERLAVWLLAFSTAVVGVQGLMLAHWLEVSTSRQLAPQGSLSGALVGGLAFGVGMVLTRGCASRLLVLSANGNLRALLSGLVFAVTAQAAWGGALVPLRAGISAWWTVEGGPARDLLAITRAGHWGGLACGLAWMAWAVYLGVRGRVRAGVVAGAVGVGLAVAAAWWFSYGVSTQSFDPVQVRGMSFSGPSAEWLMRVLATPSSAVGFDFGLLPGVFAGSFVAAWWAGELKLEGFRDGHSMTRYILGAVLMGFGAMLAGGCAVGAGMTGGAIFALTAWLSLLCMWLGAGVADRLVDG